MLADGTGVLSKLGTVTTIINFEVSITVSGTPGAAGAGAVAFELSTSVLPAGFAGSARFAGLGCDFVVGGMLLLASCKALVNVLALWSAVLKGRPGLTPLGDGASSWISAVITPARSRSLVKHVNHQSAVPVAACLSSQQTLATQAQSCSADGIEFRIGSLDWGS